MPVPAETRLELAEILVEAIPTPFWQALRQVGVERAVGVLPRHHVDWRQSRWTSPGTTRRSVSTGNCWPRRGLSLDVIEDNPPMDAIRLGGPGREEELEIFAGWCGTWAGSGSRCSVTTGCPSWDGCGHRPASGAAPARWSRVSTPRSSPAHRRRPRASWRARISCATSAGSSTVSSPSPRRPACASRCTRTIRPFRPSAASTASSRASTASAGSWNSIQARSTASPCARATSRS